MNIKEFWYNNKKKIVVIGTVITAGVISYKFGRLEGKIAGKDKLLKLDEEIIKIKNETIELQDDTIEKQEMAIKKQEEIIANEEVIIASLQDKLANKE